MEECYRPQSENIDPYPVRSGIRTIACKFGKIKKKVFPVLYQNEHEHSEVSKLSSKKSQTSFLFSMFMPMFSDFDFTYSFTV